MGLFGKIKTFLKNEEGAAKSSVINGYYDKAKWQIDGGLEEEKVSNHFKTLFNWLKSKNFLTQEGLEEYEYSDPLEYILKVEHLTKEGNKFLDTAYDEYVKRTSETYGDAKNIEVLEEMYQIYIKNNNIESE